MLSVTFWDTKFESEKSLSKNYTQRNHEMSYSSVKTSNFVSLFRSIRRKVEQEEPDSAKLLDPHSECAMVHLLEKSVKEESNVHKISSYYLSKAIGSTRWKIRARQKILCSFGFIECYSDKWQGVNRRSTATIKINPLLLEAIKTGIKASIKAEAVKYFCNLGIRRLQYDTDIMGFDYDMPFGENPDGTETSYEPSEPNSEMLNRLVENSSEKKAKKAKDDAQWRDYSERFVNGAADIWTKTQTKLGYGTSKPSWCGTTSTLSDMAKKEKRELVKIFQQYGGKITSLAWYVFCALRTEKDEKGKVVYDDKNPHQQFVFADKRPTQFAKNFNSVIHDPHFIKFSRESWDEVANFMKENFDYTLDLEPRYGDSTRDKIGYNFGDKGPYLKRQII